MYKIQRVSQVFYWLFLIGLFVTPVCYIISWVCRPETLQFGGASFFFGFLHDQRFDFATMPAYVRAMGLGISLIPMTISMLVLWHFVKLFRMYKQGLIFSAVHVNYIRRIGIILLIGELLDPLYQMFMSFLLSIPKAHYSISINFGSSNFHTIIMASLIILIAWIMGEAYKLQQDQQLTI